MDFAYRERAQRLFERFPVVQRLDRAAIFYFQELAGGGDDQAPLAAAVPRDLARRIDRRSRIPSCAARSPRPTRSAASGSCSPTSGIRR